MSRTITRTARTIARNVLPPIAVKAMRSIAGIAGGRGVADWEIEPGGWPAESARLRGWDSESVVSTQLSRWEAFVESTQDTRPFGISHESAVPDMDYSLHNTVMCFAYVLARAARRHDRLSILDWGGGIGHYFVYARALIPDLALDYSCYDLPFLADGGRRVLPEATFPATEEAALARRYDLVVASGSLHYSEDWRAVLSGLAGVCDDYLYVTRQPCLQRAPSYVVVQRPYRHGYQTEYPGWFLNEGEFLGFAQGLGLSLVREFLIQERPMVPHAPEQADYRGFLFKAPKREK